MIHTKLASCTTVYNSPWLRCTWESVHRGTKTILNKHRQRVQDQHQRVSSHNNHTASQVPLRRQPPKTPQIPITWRHDTISFHHKDHQYCCCKSSADTCIRICVVYANVWLYQYRLQKQRCLFFKVIPPKRYVNPLLDDVYIVLFYTESTLHNSCITE